MEAFSVARDRILRESAEKQTEALRKVRLKGNRGGYLPALTQCACESLRDLILALSDAWVEEFTLREIPCSAEAEKDLDLTAKQMAAGAIAALRGQLDLTSRRIRIPFNDSTGYINREIGESMNSALKEGKLRIKRQRITQNQLPKPEKRHETTPSEGGEDLQPNVWLKIRASLLGIDPNGPNRKETKACLNEGYHVFARGLSGAGEPLSDSLLHEKIPARVFQWAVARKWLPYPPQRARRSMNTFAPGKYQSAFEPIPDDELTVPFGAYMLTEKYKLWILRQLELAIAQWEAARVELGTRGATPPEHTVGNKSADSTFWRIRREEFEALPPGEYSLIWSSHLPTSLEGQLLPSQWSWWRCPDGSLRARLSAIALKCAKALGRDSEDGWFDELRKADFVAFKLTGHGLQRQPDGNTVDDEFGPLKQVVKHSITLCHVLEAEVHDGVSKPSPTDANTERARNRDSNQSSASSDETHDDPNHPARVDSEVKVETAGDGRADSNGGDPVANERGASMTAFKLRGR